MHFKKISRSTLIGSIMAGSVGVLYALPVDITQLPLGDGKISTTPKAGYIYTCPTSSLGGGAQSIGSWIHGPTWNLKEKIHVQGSVSWPNAQLSISSGTEGVRTISGNGLPIGAVTGVFPIASTDPAYVVDHNPNSITTQLVSYSLPTMPLVAQSPSCVPRGVIGIALNGVAIFNALDAENRDAMAHEVQDVCNGHPERQGRYHYHGASPCLPHQGENAALVGYALDGFGIYSNHDTQGNEITTKDLDECHGTTSEVMFDGKKVSMYHYVITQDYPYTIGCFKGTPVKASALYKVPVALVGSENIQAVRESKVISSDLTFGSKGDDVISLQTSLEKGGVSLYTKRCTKRVFWSSYKRGS